MIKDAVEDYKRHRSDAEINNRLCKILVDGEIKEKKAMDLTSGDWAYIETGEKIEADVLLVKAINQLRKKQECGDHCFINTANLDGESNLKKKTALILPFPDQTTHQRNKICDCYLKVKDNLKCFEIKDSSDSFNDFRCQFQFYDGNGELKDVLATDKNILFRGSILKTTISTICLVLAVGEETKQFKSTNQVRKGKSIFEKKMDYSLIYIALIYIVILGTTTAFGSYMAAQYQLRYINQTNLVRETVRLFFSNYILYSYLVPLSLYVMIEVSRFFHSKYIGNDDEMTKNGVKAICRNSNVVEDLGSVEYLLSDKTGTITNNSMTLRAVHVPSSRSLITVGEFFELLKSSINGRRSLASRNRMRRTFEGNEAASERNESASERNETASERNESPSLPEGNGQETEPLSKGNEVPLSKGNEVPLSKGNEVPLSKGNEVPLSKGNEVPLSEGNEVPPANNAEIHDELMMFIYNIMVCNSVELLNKKYEGISQDELCFLYKIREYGYELVDRDEYGIILKIRGRPLSIKMIYTVDFTSKRQSMTVICEIDGKFYLFRKGSDQKLLDKDSESDMIKLLNKASDYRSLVFKYKEIGEKDLKDIFNYQEGVAVIPNEKYIDKIDAIATGLRYSGSTFIEDELQDNVRETMQILRRAGLRIWMVTGDKRETAVSCARNSGIIGPGEDAFEIEGKDVVEELVARNEAILKMGSVIIFRATPSQKGKIAELLVDLGKNTLAIGDGNNDVSMLKKSNIGVGIIGKEGTQASLAADFAIPEFQMLKKLVLIHGRYNLIRYSKISINSFYKNIVFILIQFFYNFVNSGSGRSIYNEFFFNYYNLFFTSLVPFSIALFDRDQPQHLVYLRPESYQRARAYFNARIVLSNLVFAIVESAFIFFILFFTLSPDVTSQNGKLGGYHCISTLFSIFIFSAVLLRQIRSISYMVWYSFAAIFLSIILKLIMLFGVQELAIDTNSIVFHILGMPVFYMIAIAMSGVIYFIDTVFDITTGKMMESITNDAKEREE